MIPNQIEITSDTQTMRDLLKEGIDFYHLTPAEHKEFFLVDTRLKKLLNPDILVKDHFPFRKGTTPQVLALRTDPGQTRWSGELDRWNPGIEFGEP